MINIIDYQAYLCELLSKVNSELPESIQIDKCIMAAEESQLTKRLADTSGILLCSSFPDAELDVRNVDSHAEDNKILMYVLKKVAPGNLSYEEELQLYGQLQVIMNKVKEIIIRTKPDCNLFSFGAGKIRTEWEYNQFGGHNGLSIGLNVSDYD